MLTSMNQIRAWRTQLYDYEVPQMQQLQQWVDSHDLGERLQWVSKVGDPGLLFTLYVPIACALCWRSGVRLLGAGILCEWSNQVLKWILHGERPYWYVLDNPNKFKHLIESKGFKQNPMTCETGPGLPSGHVMINMVIWLVLADTVSTKILERYFGERSTIRLILNRLCWNLFIAMQVFVGVSRVYNLNHFPHQVLVGFFCALIVINLGYKKHGWVDTSSTFKAVFLALTFLGAALTVHKILMEYGTDPDWSIRKATKYCENKSWIYRETLPYYAMVRYAGASLGLAFAITLTPESARSEHGFSDHAIRLVLGVASGFAASLMHKAFPKDNIIISYGFDYSLNAVLAAMVLLVVPILSSKCLGHGIKEEAEKTKKKKK